MTQKKKKSQIGYKEFEAKNKEGPHLLSVAVRCPGVLVGVGVGWLSVFLGLDTRS